MASYVMNLVAPVVKRVAVRSGMLCLKGCRNPLAVPRSTRSGPCECRAGSRTGQAQGAWSRRLGVNLLFMRKSAICTWAVWREWLRGVGRGRRNSIAVSHVLVSHADAKSVRRAVCSAEVGEDGGTDSAGKLAATQGSACF